MARILQAGKESTFTQKHPYRSMNAKTFKADDPVLPMNYPSFCFRFLHKEGHDSKQLLEGTGLTVEHLLDPDFRTGFPALRRFYLNALALADDQHLGVRIAQRFEPAYVGLPAYAAMNAASFKMALLVLTRYFFLSFPGIDFCLLNPDGLTESNEASVRLRPKFPLDELAYFGTSSAIVGCNGLLKGILRTPQVATRGELTVGEPSGWSEIAGLVGFPIQFNASENRLIFSSEILNQPLPGADPINHRRLLRLCEKFALDADGETTLSSRVLSLLETEGNIGIPLTKAAAKLGYSPRSLRRELEETGTSYRLLVEQVRERRARQLLAGSTRSIQAIAYELGYEAPSNFSRSFKRWTGVSPGEYRDAQHGSADNCHK